MAIWTKQIFSWQRSPVLSDTVDTLNTVDTLDNKQCYTVLSVDQLTSLKAS